MAQDVEIITQRTPNPNSIKLTVVSQKVSDDSLYYQSADEAEHPLAKALFTVDGVTGVFLLNNFVTVDKDAGDDWQRIVPNVEETIREYFREA